MMRGVLKRIFSRLGVNRKKVSLIVALVAIVTLVGVGTSSYKTIYNAFGPLPTQAPPPTVASFPVARAAAVGQCKPADTSPACVLSVEGTGGLSSLDNNNIKIIEQLAEEQQSKNSQLCQKRFLEVIKSEDSGGQFFNESALVARTITINDSLKCEIYDLNYYNGAGYPTIKMEEGATAQIDYILKTTTKAKSFSVPSFYEGRDEQVKKVSLQNENYDFDLELISNSFNLLYKKFIAINKYEIYEDISISSVVSGYLKGRFIVESKKDTDFSGYARDFAQKNDYKVSDVRWTQTITSSLNFSADLTWNAWKVDTEKSTLQYCQTKCVMTLVNDLYFKGDKLGQKDGIKGTVTTGQFHKEIYTGSSANSNSFTWGRDLTVDKEDSRYWNHELNNQKEGYGSSWVWYGDTTSKAHLEPFNGISIIDDKIGKVLNLKSVVKHNGKDFASRYYGGVDKIEKKVGEGASGVITRTGTGSAIWENPLNDPGGDPGPQSFIPRAHAISNTGYYEGIFDNTDANAVKITESDQAGFIGLYRNPFDGKTDYTKSVITDQLSIGVPGYFSVGYGDGEGTVISSKPIELVPQEVYIFQSYFGDKNEASFSGTYNKILNFLNAKAKGIKVYTFDTSDRESFISATKSVSNGAMIINLGHGSPTGLYLSRPKEHIAYSELESLVQDKNLSVFMASSCFAGQSSIQSLAKNIFASINFGWTGESTSDTGRFIGVNYNKYNYFENDLIQALSSIYGVTCSTTGSTGTQTAPVD